MEDATQFSQPNDEHQSGHLGGQLAGGSGEAANFSFESGPPLDEPGPQDADLPLNHAEPSDSAAEVTATNPASEIGDVIEIEWEAEVDAFVQAEANQATAESEAGTDQAAEPGEPSSSRSSDGMETESAEVALGLESACHCFAGAIGATEEPAPQEDFAGASDGAEAAPQQNSLPETQSEPSPSVNDETLVGAPAMQPKPVEDRRKRRRAMISAPVRVRGLDLTNDGPDEISTTIDVSRNGILFVAKAGSYHKGMDVAVVFPYSGSPTAIHAEQCGRVVRTEALADGRMAVAVALGIGVGEDLIDAAGKKLAGCSAAESVILVENAAKKPLVLAMDPDGNVRVSVKTYLEAEGYEVIAVGSVVDACHVLDILQPALVLAEIEGEGLPGEGMPGYDLCVHIKETPRFKRIPVVLTTRSGYPSDYSNAHALGAIVCMAKPYKQERLGHIVRLLAPLPAHKEAPAAASCKPDPKRKACATPHPGAGRGPLPQKKYDENTNLRRKSRFPSFR
jgi:CheY-like chemotaxis protein